MTFAICKMDGYIKTKIKDMIRNVLRHLQHQEYNEW